MRFITEFELENQPFNDVWAKAGLQNKKEMLQSALGDLIAESFGWQNPVNGNELHHRLEIEAFPMDKWIEFKQKILNMKLYYQSDIRLIEQYFTELESFGKPAGDTITNIS